MSCLQSSRFMKKIPVILVAGGTSSGKSEFAKWFKNSILIALDSFYLPKSRLPKGKDDGFNFDTPKAIDMAGCAKAIKQLVRTGKTKIPLYSFAENDRVGEEEIKLKRTTRFIILEGMFVLHNPLLELGDIKIFLDTPAELRIARRMHRDIQRKNRTKQRILEIFILTEDGYQKYVETTKKHADLIIPFSFNPVKF